jgi:hypothetical protein
MTAAERAARAVTDAELTIEHIKRIISDALDDDSWRERAAAALE